MDYKKDIEKLLFHLKEIKIERPQIEKELNYSENYIDQVLSKGGNKRFYTGLKKYADSKLQKATSGPETEVDEKSKQNRSISNNEHNSSTWQLNEDEQVYFTKTQLENEYLKKRIEDLERLNAAKDLIISTLKNGSPPPLKKAAGG